MSRHWSTMLKKLSACSEAVEWAAGQPDYETAWASCKRGDWMLWLLACLRHAETSRLAYWCTDRAVRIHAPAALDAAGLHDEAAKLRALPEIVDKATARQGAARAARAARAASDARAARAASAAWDASVASAAWAASAAMAMSAAWAASDASAASATWKAEKRLQAEHVREVVPVAPSLPDEVGYVSREGGACDG